MIEQIKEHYEKIEKHFNEKIAHAMEQLNHVPIEDNKKREYCCKCLEILEEDKHMLKVFFESIIEEIENHTKVKPINHTYKDGFAGVLCGKCDTIISDDDIYCNQCGCKLDWSEKLLKKKQKNYYG